MLFILGNIRKKLLAGKKVGTYLLYSIGEIILVVIGILIAVSIDNFNESNQRQKLEIKLLNELIVDLESQASDIQNNIFFQRESEKSCGIIRRALLENLPFQDSLKKHFTNTYDITVLANKNGAYKMLETFGSNLIANDSLRFQVTNYYETMVPLIIKVEEVTIEKIMAASEKHMGYFKNFRWTGEMEPWDIAELKANRSYLSWLSYIEENKNMEVLMYEKLLAGNQNLVAFIRQEINLLKNH